MNRLKMLSFAAALVGIALALVHVVPGYSYLPQIWVTNNQANLIFWTTTPTWLINPDTTGAKVVGTGNVSVTTVLSNSFSTWTSVTTAPNSGATAAYGGTSALNTFSAVQASGLNVICFNCTGVSFGTGTLALTFTTFNTSGSMLQADMYFNPSPSSVCFTTDDSTPCTTNTDTPIDMQTVATHEIGHFFGLDHSPIAGAVMYPFAAAKVTTLGYDDLAGISLLYPKMTPDVPTGTITGKVTLAGGSAVFGAHVFANSTTTTNPFFAYPTVRKTPVGTLTLADGTYTITGVPVDSYIVIAEPLDGPVADSNVSWAPEWSQPAVQTNFTTRWH